MNQGLKARACMGSLLLAVLLGFLYCSGHKDGRYNAFAAPVIAEPAVSMDVPVELEQIGTVEAINSVSVTARASGQLLAVRFREGQDVAPGDLLFQIDPAPYKAALAQAEANLERDAAALVNADSDVARYEGLVQKDYVTKQTYDAAVSAAAQARALVRGDSAIVKNARLSLEYCTIRAPIAGRTGTLLVKEGNLIVANATTPLVTINQIAPINVRFTIPEVRLSEVQMRKHSDDLAVWAFIPPDSTAIFHGKLIFVDNNVDQSTGTILLKATFANEHRILWPGQYVRVGLVISTLHNATVVPVAALQSSQQGDFVYVVTPGDSIQFRPVVVGPMFGRWVVAEKGVTPGESVVTDGQLGLRQGSKVVVKSKLAQPAAGGEPKK